MRRSLISSPPEIRTICRERVPDQHDMAVVKTCLAAQMFTHFGYERGRGLFDYLGKWWNHALDEGAAIFCPHRWIHESLGYRSLAPPSVLVCEDLHLLPRPFGEVLIDQPVEQQLIRIKIAVICGYYIAAKEKKVRAMSVR